jgi:hypothetical protein
MRNGKQPLQVWLPPKLIQTAKIKAIREGITIQEIVETALRTHLVR